MSADEKYKFYLLIMCILLIILNYGSYSRSTRFYLLKSTILRGNTRLAGGCLVEWFGALQGDLFKCENLETTKILLI